MAKFQISALDFAKFFNITEKLKPLQEPNKENLFKFANDIDENDEIKNNSRIAGTLLAMNAFEKESDLDVLKSIIQTIYQVAKACHELDTNLGFELEADKAAAILDFYRDRFVDPIFEGADSIQELILEKGNTEQAIGGYLISKADIHDIFHSEFTRLVLRDKDLNRDEQLKLIRIGEILFRSDQFEDLSNSEADLKLIETFEGIEAFIKDIRSSERKEKYKVIFNQYLQEFRDIDPDAPESADKRSLMAKALIALYECHLVQSSGKEASHAIEFLSDNLISPFIEILKIHDSKTGGALKNFQELVNMIPYACEQMNFEELDITVPEGGFSHEVLDHATNNFFKLLKSKI